MSIHDSAHAPSPRLWIAILAPPALWYLQQQALTALTKLACHTAGPPLGPAAGLAALVLCLGAAALAWPARRDPHHRFMAWLGLGSGAIFALAIVFTTLANLLLPPCVR